MMVTSGKVISLLCMVALLAACKKSSSSSSDTPTPSPPNPEWQLVWQDEFDGAEIDRSKWSFDLGGHGWGNNELQHYTNRSENARVQTGELIIEARKEDFELRNYTSARLKTQGLASWQYGRMEARIKVPRGQGIWPAFWTLGENFPDVGWPNCGEIDVMEHIGKEPNKVYGTVHGPNYSGANGYGRGYTLANGNFADDYHVFAVEWQADEIRWYVDGQQYHIAKPNLLAGRWVFDHKFFFILNVAVGGYWPGEPDATTVFPQTMHIDYVRVYQRR